MNLTALALAGILALILLPRWYVGWMRRRYPVRDVADEMRTVTTPDGWRIATYAYRPPSPARVHPVLLVHGLSATHTSWDLSPSGPSLADHLRHLGWTVFSLDLRGRGASDGPSTGRGRSWTLEDFALRDLPSVIVKVREWTGAPRVHWVGHSEGGILGYLHQIVHGNAEVRSAVLIASALDYTAGASAFRHLIPLRSVIRGIPYVPVGFLTSLVAPLAHRGLPWNRFLWNPENLEPRVAKAMAAHLLRNASVAELKQLSTMFDPGGLKSSDGARRYFADISRFVSPLLAIAGDADLQCPPEMVAATALRTGSTDRAVKVFGVAQGQERSYGHFDLLCGRRARQEVWPSIVSWMEARDGPI